MWTTTPLQGPSENWKCMNKNRQKLYCDKHWYLTGNNRDEWIMVHIRHHGVRKWGNLWDQQRVWNRWMYEGGVLLALSSSYLNHNHCGWVWSFLLNSALHCFVFWVIVSDNPAYVKTWKPYHWFFYLYASYFFLFQLWPVLLLIAQPCWQMISGGVCLFLWRAVCQCCQGITYCNL